MKADLQNPIFNDVNTARKWLEGHLWTDGPVCSHCGTVNNGTALDTRPGLYQCNESACRKQFTVMTGTLFERSHIPLNKWLMAAFLICASKNGMSARQLHRMLGISYKSTWFMMHRIREAMREGKFPGPLGGTDKIVEADETYVGGKEKNKHVSKRKRGNIGGQGKEIAFALVERGGKVRSFHVPEVSAKTLRPILVAQVSRKSLLVTDDAGQYRIIGPEFAGHEVVNHGANEYVRGDAHTNTIEGYFSILKRALSARITTSANSTHSATLLSLTFATTSAQHLASMMRSALTNCSRASWKAPYLSPQRGTVHLRCVAT